MVHLVVANPLSGRGHDLASTRLVARRSSGATNLGRVLVVRVQLVDIEGVASLVHVRIVRLGGLVLVVAIVLHQITIDLDCLRAVALLSVQLTAVNAMAHIDRLNEEGTLFVMPMMPVIVVRSSRALLTDDGLACRVEPEIGLRHQLLVEGRVHTTGVEILGRVTD